VGEDQAETVRVGTVDAVQGTEADIVMISTVRTDVEAVDASDATHANRGGLGFLVNARRTNVAVSRAKFGLVVVCDPRVLMRDEHWALYLTYAGCMGWMVGPIGMQIPLGEYCEPVVLETSIVHDGVETPSLYEGRSTASPRQEASTLALNAASFGTSISSTAGKPQWGSVVARRRQPRQQRPARGVTSKHQNEPSMEANMSSSASRSSVPS